MKISAPSLLLASLLLTGTAFAGAFGLVLRPEIAALSMSGSSVLVAVNALLLKRLSLPAAPASPAPPWVPSAAVMLSGSVDADIQPLGLTPAERKAVLARPPTWLELTCDSQ